MTVNNYVYNNY